MISFSNLFSQAVHFISHQVYQTSTKLFFITSADMNNDQHPDVLFTEPADTLLQWFKNEGNGNVSIFDKRTNTKVWESGARGTSNSKLYKANLLDKSGKCVLEITDKDNKFIWRTPN